MILNLSWYINFIVLAVVLATLMKLVVILKLVLRNIPKDSKYHVFKHNTPSQHGLTCIILFLLK